MSFAKLEILRSSAPAPTCIVSSSISSIFEKFGPSLITTPLTPSSLINVFEPAPSIVIFNLFSLTCFKNSINWFSFSGLKNNSAGPPRLNQLYFESLMSEEILLLNF